MNRGGALLAVSFTAGLLGGLAHAGAAWLAGHFGISDMLQVLMKPDWNSAWLYPQLVWGGIWGLAYYFTVGRPRSRQRWVRKGLWVSLLPTAVQLFLVFPHLTSHGMFGLGLGRMTPLLIFALNLVWGLFTGFFTRLLWGRN
ncbi:MAG: hypothetical protein C0616_15480 [Desulfuromonas sp.]|nr:MAG: hypothetical protein C0616_15480 [Desulfuromonas sp.]